MAISLTVNGISYSYPQSGDPPDWGTSATLWAQAVSTGMLQKQGGLFQLTAEVDFGTTFGLKSLYFKSRSAGIASTGQLRLAHADTISFRNLAGLGDLNLTINAASDILRFNNIDLVDVSSTQTLVNKTFTFPSLAGFTASRAVETSATGIIQTSTVTSSALGHIALLTTPAVGTTQAQTIGGKTFAQDLVSSVDTNYDLGYISTRWRDLYLSRYAYIEGSVTTPLLNMSSGGNTWALSALSSVAISDNTTNDVFSITLAGNENVVVNYSLVRGSAKETGVILVTSDGTAAQVAASSATINTTGVAFFADISGSNLRLRYTASNTGVSGTMKYFRHTWGN